MKNFLGRLQTWLDPHDGGTEARSQAPGEERERPKSSMTPGSMTLTQEILDAVLEEVATVKPWDPARYTSVKVLQEAPRNQGTVNLFRSCEDEKDVIAVKTMPTAWVGAGPAAFSRQHPTSSEQPWIDIAVVTFLHSQGFPYVCKPLGVFEEGEFTHVCSSFATEGDLFTVASNSPKPSRETEIRMRPLAAQIFAAVRELHNMGIVHRDLSLENILLTDAGGEKLVQVIDFGMSTLRRCSRKEIRGKRSYQAPEMHFDAPYDGFLTDGFALGIVLFGMVAQDCPWLSTQNGKCKLYDYIRTHGLRNFLRRRKVRRGDGMTLAQLFSEHLTDLLEGLLQVNPENRLTLGESCWGPERRSVWDMTWLEGAEPAAVGRGT